MKSFSAKIIKIGINPCVIVPPAILKEIFNQANKNKGAIPVKGKLNNHHYTQTLVKYAGKWRLYLNGPMRKSANADMGDVVTVTIQYNPTPVEIEMPAKLKQALSKNKSAKETFERLPASRQKEIMRYIGNLKSAEAIEKNVKKALDFLSGKQKFIGREGIK